MGNFLTTGYHVSVFMHVCPARGEAGPEVVRGTRLVPPGGDARGGGGGREREGGRGRPRETCLISELRFFLQSVGIWG